MSLIFDNKGGEIMDAKNLLESLNFSKENIHRQALVYSFSNILTLSMLSGFGVKYNIPEKKLDIFSKKINNEFSLDVEKNDDLQDLFCIGELDSLSNGDNKFFLDADFDFVKDLEPITAIYSKTSITSPHEGNLETELNLPLELDNKDFEKKLKPKTQGLLILNEVNMSRLLYDRSVIKKNLASSKPEKFIGMLLLDLAVNQATFCHNHLKNHDGLFIEKEHDPSNSNEFNLGEKTKGVDWEDQAYMILSYSTLWETLNNPKYERYFDSTRANTFKNYALELLSILENYESEIIKLDTANLSSFISSITESLSILDRERKHLGFVLSLCDELYGRQKKKGFMISHSSTNKTASLASHFKSMEALINGFQYTNFDIFLNASEKVYNNLDSIWDDNIGLFNIDGRDNIRYSSKSISYVLRALNKLLRTTTSSKIKESINNQLTDFFDSSINGTGLQSPPPSLRNNMNMLRSSDTPGSIIESMIEDKKAYVIEKGFEINKNNSQIRKYSKEFSSEYALLASDAMLNLAIEDDSKLEATSPKT